MGIQRLLDLDESWSGRMQIANQPGLLRRLAVLFAHSGDSWFILLALGALWFVDPFWKERAIALAIGVGVTALVVAVIKLIVRRQRPTGEWGSIYRKTDPHSFPSGHAARAMMLATLVAFIGPAWLAAILLVWAPLVCLARVAMGVHYLSDILAGMLLGTVIGLTLIWLL
jgi:undecaprenyl-diphosphatase